MHKPSLLLLTFVVISWTLVSGKRIPSFAGPFKVILRKVRNESKEFNSTGRFWCRIYGTHPKLNEMQYAWGRCFMADDLLNNSSIEIRVSQWSNNQWKRNAFIMKFERACSSALMHAKSIIDFLFEPHEQKCPMKKFGMREIKNKTLDLKFPQFPVFPYARYLFTIAFRHGNDITGGLIVAEVDILPRL